MGILEDKGLMTTKLTKEEQETLNAIIEHEEDQEDNLPVKLSEKIVAGLEDENIEMTVLRKIKGRKTAYLFELDEYEDMPTLLSKLRDEYGGGDFIIEGKRANGQWAFKQSICVEKPVTKEETGNNAQSDVMALITAMNESNRQQADLMREQMAAMQSNMMQAQIDAAKSQSETLMKMMEINANNKPELPQQMGPQDIVALMASVKELSGNNGADNPMELFLKGMELGRETSEGKDESVLQTAMKTFGAPLAGLAAMSQNQESPVSVPAPAQQIPVQQIESKPPAAQAPNENEPPTDDPEMLKKIQLMNQFKPYLQLLVNGAASGGDPDVYANMILDQLPLEQVQTILKEENYKELFALIPNLDQYRIWFDQLREIITEYIKDEPGENVSAQSEQENISDTETPDHGRDSENGPPPTVGTPE